MPMLRDLLDENHDEIVARARERVAQRRAPRAQEAQVEHGVPLLLKQIGAILASADEGVVALKRTAAAHGHELLKQDFTLAQIVYGYGDVCQVVADLAKDKHLPIPAAEYRVFNLCLDEAIAEAVTEWSRLHDATNAEQTTQQMGAFAHELRNLLNSTTMAFNLIREDRVAPTGKTGEVLERGLSRMRDLVNRTLAEVRLEAHVHHAAPIRVPQLVEELEIVATAEAKARQLQLQVEPGPPDLCVMGDRSLLASAIYNLMQNALKFTHQRSKVTLRVRHNDERVYIDIADECGGLPPGKAEELFRPFEQRATNVSGLGLGLSISRRAVEANNGLLTVRDLPGHGCVFTVDLPRAIAGACGDSERATDQRLS